MDWMGLLEEKDSDSIIFISCRKADWLNLNKLKASRSPCSSNQTKMKAKKWLRILLMIHLVVFLNASLFFIPACCVPVPLPACGHNRSICMLECVVSDEWSVGGQAPWTLYLPLMASYNEEGCEWVSVCVHTRMWSHYCSCCNWLLIEN